MKDGNKTKIKTIIVAVAPLAVITTKNHIGVSDVVIITHVGFFFFFAFCFETYNEYVVIIIIIASS